MQLAIAKEPARGETRVALVPESVKKLIAAGYAVAVESGAGTAAHFSDEAYRNAGATVSGDAKAMVAASDILLAIGPPSGETIASLKAGAIVIASLFPTRNLPTVRALAERSVTSFSTDAIPRTTRAQAMDTLSSMANIAGYRGALIAAMELSKYTPMFMTAAGTILPAKVFVIGAGVAGLQAIATSRRLGAQMSATDVRPEVKEQIESVGAKYVGIELKESASAGGGYAKELSEADKAKQRQLLAEQCAVCDAVITTALIGGVFAPKLISAEIVRRMRPGSVIVDLAADGGGNCELSVPGSTVVENGVKIIAPLNLAAAMPTDASTLWSRNLTNFLTTFTKDKAFVLDLNDDIQRGALVTHGGEVHHVKTKEAIAAHAASNANSTGQTASAAAGRAQ
ncbi:MAG: Re/Si-specific NAD(P)(+) transhydrogenase subunit alpha [Phycisphaerae bacterium]|jgi:NAD(P) transhydrogenase subunit alpha|nr:Re/Si-specific NAD(P)(+) transhydrogenase subunit alpha [Phycisphaerae bacterium]